MEVAMRALCLLMCFAFIIPAVSLSQINFERTYGGEDEDSGHSVQQIEDGGYVIAGSTESFGTGSPDVYLIRTDSSGDTLWTRTYGGEYPDRGWSVQQTEDGGYIVVGYTMSFGDDVYLIKTDSLGNTLWTKTYGGSQTDEGWSVQQTEDGGYIIAGYTMPFGVDYYDVYLIRTDSSGDTLWTRTYGGEVDDRGSSVQQTEDGGYIVAGFTASFGTGGYDIYLIKTDSSGDTLWTRTYGGEDDEWVGQSFSVQQTSDGGYILTGETESFGDTGGDVYLIKTDSEGDTLWTRIYGGDGADTGQSVQQTTDGGYIIAGIWSRFMWQVGGDAYLIRTNSSGDTLWTRRYGDSVFVGFDEGISIQQTTDGGYVIAGQTNSFGAGSYDVYLIKTDPDGMVGISDNKPPSLELPRSWALSQNYPNPFNPSTTIAFDVPETLNQAHSVNLTIYDIRGRCIRTLIDSELESGSHKIHWNGRNNLGESVASGIYLYTLKAADERFTRKMTILK
jgi:hypothetical protein